jgi:nucleosome binding factor SPN SPT16 subunit
LTCYLTKKLIGQIENSIDQNVKVKHIDLANKIETLIDSTAEKNKITSQLKLTEGSYDLAFNPIVQSGGVYALNFNATSSKENLSTDVIVIQMGA